MTEVEANELLECFQWSDTDFDLKHVKEELADVMVYCRNLLDELDLDEDEIINSKMDQNEAKYPVEKARGSAAKYDRLDEVSAGEELCMTEKAVPQKRTLQEWMQLLKDYDLQINDYNMALMLLFYLKNTPNEHAIFVLDQLVCRERYTDARPSNTDRAFDTYISVKKHFTSAINAER